MMPGVDAMAVEQVFALPPFLSAEFAAIRGYWNSLKRGAAEIPFTDDFKPGTLGRLSAKAALIEVFEKPQRFRFDLAGRDISSHYGGELEDRFADDLGEKPPLDDFQAQCSATVRSGSATYYRHAGDGENSAYQRLMLPLWGDGHCNAILTVFESANKGAAK
jgi:hypothetical protein